MTTPRFYGSSASAFIGERQRRLRTEPTLRALHVPVYGLSVQCIIGDMFANVPANDEMTSEELLERDFERVPSPFGMSLRPRAENPYLNITDEERTALLDQYSATLSAADSSASEVMRALSDLRFFSTTAERALALQLIESFLTHVSRDELVKSHACFSLVPLATDDVPKCIAILKVVLETEGESGVRAAAAGALGYIASDEAVEALVRCSYEDTEWLVQYSAIVALGNCRSARALDFLVQALRKQAALPDREEREGLFTLALLGAIAEIGSRDDDVVDAVCDFVGAEDPVVRRRVAEVLGALPTEQARKALLFLEKDSHEAVFLQASLSLAHLDGARGSP